MNAEEAYEQTKERTREILEFYKDYLITTKLQPVFKDKPINFKYEQTSKYYDYDAVYYLDDKPRVHVEVKVREDIELTTYPDSKLPIRKHGVALYYFQAKKIHSHYLVLFKDGLYRCILHELPDDVRSMPSRWDRGGELNEYAMYDHKRFEFIV